MNNKKGIIIGVSLVLVAVAGYFIFRGTSLTKKLRRSVEEDAKNRESASPAENIPSTTQPMEEGKALTKINARTQSVIREKPSTSSKIVKKNLKITSYDVMSEVVSGGMTWYQVTDGTISGFLRADSKI